MPYQRITADVAQWTVQALTRLISTYAIVQGVGIVVGGHDRWMSPALRIALGVPGAPASWGFLILAAGLLGLVLTFKGHPRHVLWPMIVISMWSFFFGLALFPSVIAPHSHTATTGSPVYTVTALFAIVLGVAYRRAAP